MTIRGEVLDAAAEWFAILGADPVAERDRQRWREWLALSPEHALAWQRVEAISRPFAASAAPSATTADKVLERAGALSRRRALHLLGLAGATIGAGAMTQQLLPWRPWSYGITARFADHRTAIGETRDLRLAEGTRLMLNTATAVDVDYSRRLRRIGLRAGEILIESARDDRDPPRPLVVDTALGRLTALGTRFSVRDEAGAIAVAVYDGAVHIEPARGGAQVLGAGHQARFNAGAVRAAAPADPARESWSRGMLIADDIRLDRFVAELARYTPVPLSVAPAASALQLVGAYPIGRPERDVPQTLLALERALPVRVVHGKDGVRIEAR